MSVTGVFEDVLFLAGGRVGVNARGEDDVVAAGGDLTVQGASADHMMLGAYKIVFVDSQAADLFAAGVDLSFLSGRLADDMVAAAGQLVLRPAFAVDGTAVLSGADVVVEAPVGGELRVLGGVVRIDAAIGGDVDVTANRLVIGPGARIEGDLRHRAGTVEIAPAATVVGETIALEPPAGEVPKAAGRVFFAAAVLGLLFTLGMVVLVLVTITLLPGLMGDSAQMIRARPLATLGIGGLIVAAAPLVLGLLFASVIGIPLALLIAALYLAAAPLALAASTYTGGLWARRQLREQAAAPGTAGPTCLWICASC